MTHRAIALFALTFSVAGCVTDEGPTSEEPPAKAADDPAAGEASKATPSPSAEEKAAEKAARKATYAEAQSTPPADVAAPPADAEKTATGLAYKVLKAGSGESPNAWDIVEVEYKGWTTDGKLFDSSFKRASAAQFPLNKVIPGWTEGVQLMKVGESTRFWIPVDLAYGGRPGAPAGMLVFDIELKEIDRQEEPPPPPETPSDVAAPPADAKKTATGLAYKVLKAGDGAGAKPGPTSQVKVHYSGWTTDGKMFDSSVSRGKPATFPLNAVIPGWTEGLQLMSPGDSYRFWIPVDLAYANRPGKPAGMLVFDVDLLEVK